MIVGESRKRGKKQRHGGMALVALSNARDAYGPRAGRLQTGSHVMEPACPQAGPWPTMPNTTNDAQDRAVVCEVLSLRSG